MQLHVGQLHKGLASAAGSRRELHAEPSTWPSHNRTGRHSEVATHISTGPQRAACWDCVSHRHASVAAPAAATVITTTDDVGSSNNSQVATASSSGMPLPHHWEQQMKTAPLGKKRVLDRYCQQLLVINSWEPKLRQLPDEQLKAKTAEFKTRLAAGARLDQILPEAFAVVRETSRRVLGMRHFDSQMVGGMVLHDGQIAEMSTGEGKTLVATLPAYLNALSGYSVHVVTVNDYLAARDAEWMGKIYSFLGLTCASVCANMSNAAYKAAYGCDITYVTGQELGFSYLRDNTAPTLQDLVLPSKLHYAIIDEADSILIDESRNPLIISLPIPQSESAVLLVDKLVRPMYEEVRAKADQCADIIRMSYASKFGDRMTETLRQSMEANIKTAADEVKSIYYKVDMQSRSITLSPIAIQRILSGLEAEGIQFRNAQHEDRAPVITDVFEDPMRWGQLAVTAFKAYELFQLGKQYIVRDGRVVIINEHTGRLLDITRWQDGLHQAVEAKEGVPIKEETLQTATITFQVFFTFYSKLAGMTGTATPAAAEFYELYKLKVVTVPTNLPVRRTDLPSRFYFDPALRAHELCRIIQNCWARGRPVLIGTTSVQQSELVLQLLHNGTQYTFAEHNAAIQVLNAKPEKVRMEAEIVAQAGLPGCVTIATNMAGRGTDIILGGSAEGLTKLVLIRLVYVHMMSDEDAAAIPALPYKLKQGPLGLYDKRSVKAAMDAVNSNPAAGLPFEVHMALLGAMLLSDAEALKFRRDDGSQPAGDSNGSGDSPLRYEQAQSLASWVIGKADFIRREAYDRIREKFEGIDMNDLEFSVCIAPVLSDVLLEHEKSYINAPQGQVMALKAAVLLRAWLDRQCAEWCKQVRQEGGLLVIGMSMQDSKRVELQLRGRAGRQGDPGVTLMMYDMYDPKLMERKMTAVFEMVRQMDNGLGAGAYVDGPLLDALVATVQREAESQYSNARLEMKRYDEVVEAYRKSVYSLRKLILSGSTQQCTQVLYMFIQSVVDQLVHTYLGCGTTNPTAWLQPTLPLASLPSELRQAAAVQGNPNMPVTEATQQQQGSCSPLQALMLSLEQLLNPRERTGTADGGSAPQWQFQGLTKESLQDETVRNVLSFFGVLDKAGAGDSAAGAVSGGSSSAELPVLSTPLEAQSLTLLTHRQVADVAAFITDMPVSDVSDRRDTVLVGTVGMPAAGSSVQGETLPATTAQPSKQTRRRKWLSWVTGRHQHVHLPWPEPPMALTAKQHLLLMTHAKLYGISYQLPWSQQQQEDHTQQQISASNKGQAATDLQLFTQVTGLPAGSATAHAFSQRPQLEGAHAGKVSVLRNYFGLVLLHAFEQRRVAATKAILAAHDGVQLDMDAQQQVWGWERDVMLMWLDAVWSVFLQDLEVLKKAVAVKSYTSSSPLAEFRLEANRSFLGMMATYREAVVAKVLVPEINIFTPLMDEDDYSNLQTNSANGSLLADWPLNQDSNTRNGDAADAMRSKGDAGKGSDVTYGANGHSSNGVGKAAHYSEADMPASVNRDGSGTNASAVGRDGQLSEMDSMGTSAGRPPVLVPAHPMAAKAGSPSPAKGHS